MQTVRIVFDVRLYDTNPWPGGAKKEPPPILTVQHSLTSKWTLVDEATVKVIGDPTLRAAIEKAVTVRESGSGKAGERGEHLTLNIDAAAPPVSLAYEVIAHAGEKDWKVGRVQFSAGKNHGWNVGQDLPGFKAEHFDVILRPSVLSAEESVDLTEMWDGEIVVRDVKARKGP